MHHKAWAGLAIFFFLGALVMASLSSTFVSFSVSKKDPKANHRTAYMAQLATACLAAGAAGIAGILALAGWFSPTHGKSLRHYRSAGQRHLPWYVAAFGSACFGFAFYASSKIPSGAEGQKVLAEQNWVNVATIEASLSVVGTVGLALAGILLIVGGGLHARGAHFGGTKKAGGRLFQCTGPAPDVIHVYRANQPQSTSAFALPPPTLSPKYGTANGVDPIYGAHV